MEVKKKLYWNCVVFIEYLKINFLSLIEYKASFFVGTFGMLLNDVALLFFWWALFKRIDVIKGWNMKDVFTLFALVTASFGLSTGFFGNAMRLSSMIIQNELDFYLTLPKSPLLHLLVSKTSFFACADVIFGFILYIFLVGTSFKGFLLFLIMVVLSSSILTSFSILISSLSFYIETGGWVFSEIVYSLNNLSMYPLPIFPEGIKVILYTLLPAAFIGYVPASIVKEFSFKYVFILLIALFSFAISGLVLFNKGLKKYSSGSVIGSRM
ncbi:MULTISPECIES: ABC transporter permease [unclassified Caldisericum]|uniref:ABC transporter permease n=1 Tax=unclassified Caldisericum TaxID=2641600 RepID=UPI0039FD6C69